MVNSTLSLSEQILLLHLDEHSGQIQGTYTPLLVTAATVAELALQGRVEVTETGVISLSSALTDDPEWNNLLTRLQAAHKSLFLSQISNGEDRRRLIRATAGRLVGRGIWAVDQERFLFTMRSVYRTREPLYVEQVKCDIQNALESRQPVEERRLVLIGLLDAAQRLNTVLTKQEQRASRERIKTLIARSPLAFALSRMVEKVISDDEDAAATAAIVAIISS